MRYKTLIAIFGIMSLLILSSCTIPQRPEGNIATNQHIQIDAATQKFSRDISSLNFAQESQEYHIKNDEIMQLSADIIKKEFAGKEIRAFGYNRQISGPMLFVGQNEEIYLNFTNNLDAETAIHWHGLRVENKYDGVPGTTQPPIKPQENFLYKLRFTDPGLYWFHPHMREDYQQELGLYGTILVKPEQEDYYNKVNREEIIVVDDILLQQGDVYPFAKDSINNALMGRFGNLMLVNGKINYELAVDKGSRVRFYILNAANSRTFNLSIAETKLKLVGSDVSSYEKEAFVDSIIISPGERYIAEALFDKTGTFELKNINPFKQYYLGKIKVSENPVLGTEDYSNNFRELKENKYVKQDIESYRKFFDKEIDSELILRVSMQGMPGSVNRNMMVMSHKSEDKIEWEDTMAMMNRRATDRMIEWQIIEKKTGKKNMDISFSWKIGDKIKLRIFNDQKSMHPMQHPIHFHGQRFLVLEQDGKKNNNLAWKDTVLVPVGSYVDILFDISNPGSWMAHCHIAEHLHSNMIFGYSVS